MLFNVQSHLIWRLVQQVERDNIHFECQVQQHLMTWSHYVFDRRDNQYVKTHMENALQVILLPELFIILIELVHQVGEIF